MERARGHGDDKFSGGERHREGFGGERDDGGGDVGRRAHAVDV